MTHNEGVTISEPIPDLIEPIRLSTRVRRDIEATFDLFTGDLTGWWPSDRFSFAPGRVAEVIMEPFAGGRFYERYTDGGEYTIGEVLAWDRPTAVTFTWRHHEWAAPTEVSVRFVAEDPLVTRVDLEHRAWERLGTLGRESRAQYANGWPTVLGCFAQVAGEA